MYSSVPMAGSSTGEGATSHGLQSPGSETTSNQQPSPPPQSQVLSSHVVPAPYYPMKPEGMSSSVDDVAASVCRAAENANTIQSSPHHMDDKVAGHTSYSVNEHDAEVGFRQGPQRSMPVMPYLSQPLAAASDMQTANSQYPSFQGKESSLSMSMIPPATDGVSPQTSTDNMTPSHAEMTSSTETGEGGDPHADARHSCHQCKTRRPNAEMYYCNNHPPSGRKSKKLDANGNPLPAPPNPRRKRRLCRKKVSCRRDIQTVEVSVPKQQLT